MAEGAKLSADVEAAKALPDGDLDKAIVTLRQTVDAAFVPATVKVGTGLHTYIDVC